MGEEVRDRFLACEERKLPPPDGEPLVYCAITDGIAVGFPSAPEWDRDRVTVHFDELLPDGSTEPSSEEIDQLTRALHASPIRERHRDRLREGGDPVLLWEIAAPANRPVANRGRRHREVVRGLRDRVGRKLASVGHFIALRSAGPGTDTCAARPRGRCSSGIRPGQGEVERRFTLEDESVRQNPIPCDFLQQVQEPLHLLERAGLAAGVFGEALRGLGRWSRHLQPLESAFNVARLEMLGEHRGDDLVLGAAADGRGLIRQAAPSNPFRMRTATGRPLSARSVRLLAGQPACRRLPVVRPRSPLPAGR